MKTKNQIIAPVTNTTVTNAPEECKIPEVKAITFDSVTIEANGAAYVVELVEKAAVVTSGGKYRVKVAASTIFGGSNVTRVSTCAADTITSARDLACTTAARELCEKLEKMEQVRLDRAELSETKIVVNAYLVNIENICNSINRASVDADNARLKRALKLENIDANTCISSGNHVFIWRQASQTALEKGLKSNEKLYAFGENQLICKRELITLKGSVQAINIVLRSMKGAALLAELLEEDGANAAIHRSIEDFGA